MHFWLDANHITPLHSAHHHPTPGHLEHMPASRAMTGRACRGSSLGVLRCDRGGGRGGGGRRKARLELPLPHELERHYSGALLNQ